MSDPEPITLGVLATSAISATLGNVTDRQLRSGLRLILTQAQRGELARNIDVAAAARRAQMLALKLSLRGYEHLPVPETQITRPLSTLIYDALSAPTPDSLDRSAQATMMKQMEAAFDQAESPDGTAQSRQRAVRRLAENWTIEEAHARARHPKDWPRFEKLVRDGDGSGAFGTPSWWDAFRAFMADEIRRDMRLASILTQRGLVEILGRQNDLKTVLAHMSEGQEGLIEAMAPALAALRTGPTQLKRNLERFEEVADEIAHTAVLIRRAAEADTKAHDLEAGRRVEALAASLEATGLYRELVAKDREVFLPRLARSLNNLGRLANGADGLKATTEALGYLRELAPKSRDYAPDLAKSLDQLANSLSSAGREGEALGYNIEAVGLYRDLAKKERGAFLPALATSMQALAGRLSGAGRRSEALAATEELVGLYRELVVDNRETFLPDLAMSLVLLCRRLAGAGREGEVLGYNAEAVGLYRALVDKDRGAFLPDLAASMNNLASRLSDAARRQEALAASGEAVDLGKELFAKNNEAHAAALARAYGSRGHALRAIDRLDEAIISFSDGIGALDPLMARHGEALAGLYDALANELIVTVEAAGRLDEASALRARLKRKSHE